MGCELIKPITEKADCNAELTYRYDKLRLIFDNDIEHPYIKGFTDCLEIVLRYSDLEENANTEQ